MGVNIDTDTAVPGLLSWPGAEAPFTGDGFTNGDPQALVFPTQLSARWFNAVQFEINNAIAEGGITPVYTGDEPNTAQWGQLATSIWVQDRDYYPRGGSGGVTTYRSHKDVGAEDWKEWKKTAVKMNSTQGSVQTLCNITDIPDDSQFWVTYHAECVQTDSLTTYNNIILRCSCRKSGGTVTVQKTATVDTDGAAAVTWSVVNSAGAPALQATLPAAPGKLFNISAMGIAHNVVRV